MMKMSNKREYSKRMRAINAKIDSVIRATPGHLLFTEEQRKVYTTIGGCHHLDGVYTIYGEVTEGLELIDQIASFHKRRIIERGNAKLEIFRRAFLFLLKYVNCALCVCAFRFLNTIERFNNVLCSLSHLSTS